MLRIGVPVIGQICCACTQLSRSQKILYPAQQKLEGVLAIAVFAHQNVGVLL